MKMSLAWTDTAVLLFSSALSSPSEKTSKFDREPVLSDGFDAGYFFEETRIPGRSVGPRRTGRDISRET